MRPLLLTSRLVPFAAAAALLATAPRALADDADEAGSWLDDPEAPAEALPARPPPAARPAPARTPPARTPPAARPKASRYPAPGPYPQPRRYPQPQPYPQPPPYPPNVRTGPDGGVSVTRTPAGGVDVHARTQSGTVHAYGCNRVNVDPSTATAPPPCAAPYPYPYAYPYPVAPLPTRRHPYKPKPSDPGRKAALITSSILFGVGTAAAGAAYVASIAPTHCDSWGCSNRSSPSMPALYTMGAFLTVPASVPRFVVGDVGTGLLLTGLRGGSFALGTAIDWDDKSYVLPVTFAVVIPLALGIVDLATTPQRAKAAPTAAERDMALKPRIESVGPQVARDASGELAPGVGVGGRF